MSELHVSFNDWWHALCEEVGFAHRRRNARVGIAWLYTESGSPDGFSKTARFNPLGSTWRLTAAQAPSGKASWDFNTDAHVQNFAALEDGLYATRLTLFQQAHGFPLIVKRFRALFASATSILDAIEESDWGTEGLIREVFGDIRRGGSAAYWQRADTLVAGSF
jgi:hypothetical protein